MMEGPVLLFLLALAVAFIIFATARIKLHPFIVLLLTSYGLGMAAGLSPADTIAAITGGFGNLLGKIGIVIAAGTIIGAILEKSGGALVMAETVLKCVGRARAVLAMSITGAVVSIPVFCDSGYVILSPLNRSLAKKSKEPLAVFAVALSMGLYATHVFVPPTPGPIAAAGILKADLGLVIVLGIIASVPVIISTYFFARYAGRRVALDPERAEAEKASGIPVAPERKGEKGPPPPSPAAAFAPILIPVFLIALKSTAELPSHPFGEGHAATFFSFVGNPNTALILGVFLAFLTARKRGEAVYGDWVGGGLRNAGTIILITGAGGSLGMVIRETGVGEYLGRSLSQWDFGGFSVLLPFLLAASLKTALGSSTVAIITTASLIAPLLPSIGLDSRFGLALATVATGAGSMTVSHANDSYFWVVSQFSGMSTTQAYKLITLGSAVAGFTGIATVQLLSWILL